MSYFIYPLANSLGIGILLVYWIKLANAIISSTQHRLPPSYSVTIKQYCLLVLQMELTT